MSKRGFLSLVRPPAGAKVREGLVVGEEAGGGLEDGDEEGNSSETRMMPSQLRGFLARMRM